MVYDIKQFNNSRLIILLSFLTKGGNMGKDQHVTLREDGKWQVLGENNSKATAVFDTQKEAYDKITE